METFKFAKSVNQHPSMMGLISALRSQAEYMYLNPKVKSHYSIINFSVECDTPHEKKILEKLYNSYMGV